MLSLYEKLKLLSEVYVREEDIVTLQSWNSKPTVTIIKVNNIYFWDAGM